MSQSISSIQEAFLILGDPSDPRWGPAFAFLSSQPETAALMIETFRETLEQMGVAPSGTDPATGEPSFALRDIARALGLPESDLDAAVTQANPPDSLQGD
ncbi:MAG: hypothetical protein ACM3ST_14215 [Bdellovibrio bacteriovorus]